MSDKELTDAEYDALVSAGYDDEQPSSATPPKQINVSESVDINDAQEPLPASEENQPETGETVASTRSSYSELRKLQREMFRTAHVDPMGAARASAARVWRDLEILRLAKLGKPVCLSGKAPEAKRSPSPILSLSPAPDSAQAA